MSSLLIIAFTLQFTGLGLALIYSPTVAMLGQYFKRYLTTANSIMLTGGAVGMIVGPLVTEILIQEYGWKGAMLVLSAVMANSIALGATLRPVRQDAINQKLVSRSDRNVLNILLDLVRNIRYVILMMVFLLLGVVILAPNIHITARADEAGISKSQAVWLPTIIGIGNLIGRLSGLLVDKFLFSKDIANVASFALCTITYFINPFCNNFLSQTFYCIVFGFGQGSVVVFSFVLVQVLLPKSHHAVG